MTTCHGPLAVPTDVVIEAALCQLIQLYNALARIQRKSTLKE